MFASIVDNRCFTLYLATIPASKTRLRNPGLLGRKTTLKFGNGFWRHRQYNYQPEERDVPERLALRAWWTPSLVWALSFSEVVFS